jgi:archaetidylinositol phosphate synthase
MLSTLKPMSEKALRPLVLKFKNVSPNAISLLGLIFPVLFYVLVLEHLYWWALLAFIFNGVDMLDGMVARAQNKVTAFGGFLDSTIDRFADFTVLAVFGFAGIVSWKVVAPLLLASYLISYIRSRTELAAYSQGKKLTASVGIIERTERLLLVFIALALYAIAPHVTFVSQNSATVTLFILTVLSFFTVGQRVVFAYKQLQ